MKALLTAAQVEVSSLCSMFPLPLVLSVVLSLLLCANTAAPFQVRI